MMDGSYWGRGFFSSIRYFFSRVIQFFTGQLSISEFAIDETQIAVLILIGISCALLGTLLVLRRMTMLANSISHTVLLGIVAAYVLFGLNSSEGVLGSSLVDFRILTFAALISSLVTVVLTEILHRVFRLHKHVSIGLVFTFLFALGIVAVTLFTRNSHVGAEIIMGNIDMLGPNDLKTTFYLAIGNLLLFMLFYKEFLTTSFDPMFARMSRMSNLGFTYLLMFQASATMIAGLRAVGVVLIISLLVVPVVTARLVTRSLKGMMVVSVLVSTISAITSVAFSRYVLSSWSIALSTSGLVVVFQFFIWTGVFSATRIRSAIFRLGQVDYDLQERGQKNES